MDRVESLVVEDNRTREQQAPAARALFVFIGARPATSWLADAVTLDRRGFIPTGQDVAQVTADIWNPLARAPSRWRPVCPESSPSATSAAARSSGWPPQSVRAPWLSAWRTNTSERWDRLRAAGRVHPRASGGSPPPQASSLTPLDGLHDLLPVLFHQLNWRRDISR